MHRDKLKALLAGTGVTKAPGVYDGLSALLVEQAGFDLCFFSGGSYSFARHGRPDMGLVSMSEVADAVAIIRERINIPMLVDMDTGFGNALNVQRTVRLFERAGASALQMEDQVSPKRCGHMAGKDVIPAADMVGKIKAFLDARESADTLLAARTDALGVNGFEDALERGHLYLEAGADMIFIEAPQSIEQMQRISAEFSNTPLVHNLVEGGHSPVSSATELEALNYRIALYPVALLHRFMPEAQSLLAHIHKQGDTSSFDKPLFDLNDTNALLGADDLLDVSDRYGPDDN